jgi:hypothetical protein
MALDLIGTVLKGESLRIADQDIPIIGRGYRGGCGGWTYDVKSGPKDREGKDAKGNTLQE